MGRGPAIDEDETQDGLDGEVYSQGVTLGAGGIAERQAAGPAHAPRQPGTGGLSGRVRAPPGDRSVGHHARAGAARLPAGNAVEMLAEVRAWIRATAADAAAEDERREEARARREREREQFRSQERAQLLQERAQLLQQSLAFMGELTLKVAAQSAELGRAGPPRWPWPEDRPPGAEAPALAGPGAAGGAAGVSMADAQPLTAATSSAESSPVLRAASPGAEPRAGASHPSDAVDAGDFVACTQMRDLDEWQRELYNLLDRMDGGPIRSLALQIWLEHTAAGAAGDAPPDFSRMVQEEVLRWILTLWDEGSLRRFLGLLRAAMSTWTDARPYSDGRLLRRIALDAASQAGAGALMFLRGPDLGVCRRCPF